MSEQEYYVPNGTYWPIIGSIGIATLFIGFATKCMALVGADR